MIARASLSVWVVALLFGCGGNGQKTIRPSSCGGTIATQGTVGGATCTADSINVIGVNGNAISIYLADTNQKELWFTIHRDPTTNMFAAGSYQETAVYESQVGSVTVELTRVVDPFDATGQPLPGPDGGIVGSLDGTFAAQFGADSVSGTFSSPVCAVTDIL